MITRGRREKRASREKESRDETTGTRTQRKSAIMTRTEAENDEGQVQEAMMARTRRAREMRGIAGGERVTEGLEVDPDRMIMRADRAVSQFQLARSHGATMTWPAKRVSRTTRTNNQLQIETRIKLQRATRRTNQIRKIGKNIGPAQRAA